MYSLKIVNTANGKSIYFSLPSSGYVITSASGLTETDITMSTAQGNFQTGETLQGMAVSGKQSIISGVLIGEASGKRQHMLSVLSPQDKLTVIFNGKIQRTAYVRSGPTISQKPINANFQFTLYSPHPYWADVNQTTVLLGGVQGMFRFPVNYSVPHTFGRSIDQQYMNVRNEGNVPVSFKTIFFARTSVKNPRVLNVMTGEYMGLGYDELPYIMEPGEQIVIDTTTEPFLLTSEKKGVSANIFGYYDFGSTEFQINPGDNLLRYEAAENRAGLDARVLYSSEYSGAAGDDITA